MVSDMDFGSGYFDQFELLNVCARHASGLRPVAAKHDGVTALRRVTGGIVSALDEVVEQEGNRAALLAVAEHFECYRVCGGQPVGQLERSARGLREL